MDGIKNSIYVTIAPPEPDKPNEISFGLFFMLFYERYAHIKVSESALKKQHDFHALLDDGGKAVQKWLPARILI